MINRNIYEICVSKIITPPISNRYWGDRFLVDQSQWAKIYRSPYEVSYDTRLQSFHYKIMLRIFPCNNYVAKFDRSVQKSCSLCPNVVDDLCHFFITAQFVLLYGMRWICFCFFKQNWMSRIVYVKDMLC